MAPDKIKLLAAVIVGLIVGVLIGSLRKDRFSVSVLNQHSAIRIDRKTGETWNSSYIAGGLEWRPMKINASATP